MKLLIVDDDPTAISEGAWFDAPSENPYTLRNTTDRALELRAIRVSEPGLEPIDRDRST